MPFTDSVKLVKVLMLQSTQLTAAQSDVVVGKSFIGTEKELQYGTLPVDEVHGSVYLLAGQNHTVPYGKIPQEYVVYAKPLSEQTEATAIASDMKLDTTAWVNGIKITGAMPIIASEQKTLLCGESTTIAAGYHDGNGTVTAESLASQTQGNATENDMCTGKVAWVNGVQILGNLLTVGDFSKTLDADERFDIARGIHSGNSYVKVKSLAEITFIDSSVAAVAGDIKTGKKAYINGTLIEGSMSLIAASEHSIELNTAYTIPAGYHDGSGTVICRKEYYDQDLNITPTYEQKIYTDITGKFMAGSIIVSAVDALKYDRTSRIITQSTALTFTDGVATLTVPVDDWHDNNTANVYEVTYTDFKDSGNTINASGECVVVYDFLNANLKGYKYLSTSEDIEITVTKNSTNAHVFTFKSTTHTLTSGTVTITNPLSMRKYT